MGKLDGKVAIITGGARGIGREMALTFAREGSDIVIGDVLTVEMKATVQDVKNIGREAIAVKTDVSKQADANNLISSTISSFKKIDILVNDAGIFRLTPFLDITEAEWDQMMNINLKGAFFCSQAVARHMIQQKYGKIINMSSVMGLGNSAQRVAHYAASKAGVAQLTRSCAIELGPHGINVNAIAPGTVPTELNLKGKTPEEARKFIEWRASVTLLGRLATTGDIASLALFLASDDSDYITGQVIIIDGGQPNRL